MWHFAGGCVWKPTISVFNIASEKEIRDIRSFLLSTDMNYVTASFQSLSESQGLELWVFTPAQYLTFQIFVSRRWSPIKTFTQIESVPPSLPWHLRDNKMTFSGSFFEIQHSVTLRKKKQLQPTCRQCRRHASCSGQARVWWLIPFHTLRRHLALRANPSWWKFLLPLWCRLIVSRLSGAAGPY